MIWLLVRAAVFVALLLGLATGIGHLLDTPGSIDITWAGRSWSFGPLDFLALFLVAVLALWLIWKAVGLLLAAIRFLTGDETAISRFFGRSRTRRGLDALIQGLVALSEGDAKSAMAKTEKAGKLLDRPDLAALVGAQAARAAGAEDKAETYLKLLARNEKTQGVGVRGLLEQAVDRGETDRARKLAERAFALRPRDKQVLATLFDLQTGSGDWASARQTLAAEVKVGMLPREIGARRDAVLALAEARVALEAGDAARAREAAMEAHRRSPALTPAAVAAARQLVEDGQNAKAAKILRKAWRLSPHPDLAAAYAALAEDETPQVRRDRFRALVAENPGHPESKLLDAELALAAEDFPGARTALGDLAETRPTTRSLAIMAAVERGSGAADHVVRAWLAKALSAPRGERWVCEACGAVHEVWAPVCGSCRAVDSLTWKAAEGDAGGRGAEAALAPAILGALEEAKPAAPRRGAVEDAVTAEDAGRAA